MLGWPWLDDDGGLGCAQSEPGAMRASTAVGASPDGSVLDYLSGTTRAAGTQSSPVRSAGRYETTLHEMPPASACLTK